MVKTGVVPIFSLLFSLPTYDLVPVRGWTLHVDPAVEAKSELWKEVREEVDRQLGAIARVVPDEPLGKLRQVPIYVHLTSPETKCMAYHPGAEWLKEHKMDPDMAKGVEIGDSANFISWTYEQPWMLLHELAHAYHDRYLPKGFDNEEVKAAYDHAMSAKLLDSVRHWDGGMVKHYATTNQMEYFAETTESYFGQNDFFPFVRAELMNADTEGYSLMVKIWGKPQKRLAN
jgi:hypothetical protein